MFTHQSLLIIVICTLSLFRVFPGFCDTALSDTIPINELLSENPVIQNIITQVLSGDCYSLSMALYNIEKILQSTTYAGTENELLAILEYLCSNRECDQQGKTSLNIRKKAIELIGRMGGNSRYLNNIQKSEAILIALLYDEDDITVAASLIFALGMIGINTDGDSVRAIGAATGKWNDSTADNLFGFAVVASIEKISSLNKNKQEWEVYVTLIRIAQGNYGAMVRQKALEVMNNLSAQ